MGLNKAEILKKTPEEIKLWLSAYLNKYVLDLIMELWDNDMIEFHKLFMYDESINTVEDGVQKLIDWYESDGSKMEQNGAALPIFDVNHSALRELLKIKEICETTDELGDGFTTEEAHKVDDALSRILRITEKCI